MIILLEICVLVKVMEIILKAVIVFGLVALLVFITILSLKKNKSKREEDL